MSRPQVPRGFAIVEILIAVVVVTVLAVGLLGSERSGRTAARLGIEETAALGLLQQRLETLRADPGPVPLGEREFDLDPPSPLLADATATESTRLVEPGLVEIELRVRWRPHGGSDDTERRLTTWIAREDGR